MTKWPHNNGWLKSHILNWTGWFWIITSFFDLLLVQAGCEYMDQPGTYLPYTDTYLPRVNDIEECRSHCTLQSKYNCRSFNYNAFRKECFLSSDDSVSLPEGLHNDRDFIFSERGGCNSGTMDPPGIKGELAKSQEQNQISITYCIITFWWFLLISKGL